MTVDTYRRRPGPRESALERRFLSDLAKKAELFVDTVERTYSVRTRDKPPRWLGTRMSYTETRRLLEFELKRQNTIAALKGN
jgi:hypothetical protein